MVTKYNLKTELITAANKRFLSLAESYGKLDNIVICQRKEAPKRYRAL